MSFEECRNEWAVENKINADETHCVAERDSLAEIPYFLFYSKDKVKVVFDKKGIWGKKRNRDEFMKSRYGRLQVNI